MCSFDCRRNVLCTELATAWLKLATFLIVITCYVRLGLSWPVCKMYAPAHCYRPVQEGGKTVTGITQYSSHHRAELGSCIAQGACRHRAISWPLQCWGLWLKGRTAVFFFLKTVFVLKLQYKTCCLLNFIPGLSAFPKSMRGVGVWTDGSGSLVVRRTRQYNIKMYVSTRCRFRCILIPRITTHTRIPGESGPSRAVCKYMKHDSVCF